MAEVQAGEWRTAAEGAAGEACLLVAGEGSCPGVACPAHTVRRRRGLQGREYNPGQITGKDYQVGMASGDSHTEKRALTHRRHHPHRHGCPKEAIGRKHSEYVRVVRCALR